MATHSSILAWRIPWKEKPGRLQSMGLQSRTRLKRQHSSDIVKAVFGGDLSTVVLLETALAVNDLE